jgi:hypothetical protein
MEICAVIFFSAYKWVKVSLLLPRCDFATGEPRLAVRPHPDPIYPLLPEYVQHKTV